MPIHSDLALPADSAYLPIPPTCPSLASVAGLVQRETAGEVGELLAEDQPAAMKAGLERLIFHVENSACLFGGHTLNVAEHHRRAVDDGKRQDRAEHALPKLRAQHVLVSKVAPVDGLARGARLLFAVARRDVPFAVLRHL